MFPDSWNHAEQVRWRIDDGDMGLARSFADRRAEADAGILFAEGRGLSSLRVSGFRVYGLGFELMV